MKRRLAALALFAMLSLSPARPANAYEAHVLRYADTLDINTLNMWIATSGNIQTLSELTNAFFTRLDAQGNPTPELVTVIPTQRNGGISRDGKTITWHLRHGVKWSDGQPFDSSDVTYTWRVAQDKTNNIAVRDVWDRMSSITAPDKYTVVFRLKEPYATFAVDYFNTQSSGSVLPQHILGPGTNFNQSAYNALPVGIGPFRYTAFKRGATVEMEANPYYFRGLPKLHKIVYKMISDDNTDMTQLTTGELDLWDTINGTMAATAKALPGKAWSTRLSQFMSAIFFNTTKPQLKDPAVRRALRLATNRPEIFDKVVLRNGTMTESVVPRMAHGYLDLPVTKYDPHAAEAMLDAAGWRARTERRPAEERSRALPGDGHSERLRPERDAGGALAERLHENRRRRDDSQLRERPVLRSVLRRRHRADRQIRRRAALAIDRAGLRQHQRRADVRLDSTERVQRDALLQRQGRPAERGLSALLRSGRAE